MVPIDDHNINEKLKKLQAQRDIISQLAAKHGLHDQPKLESFTLINVRGTANSRLEPNSPGSATGAGAYATMSPHVAVKDKVKSYHQ